MFVGVDGVTIDARGSSLDRPIEVFVVGCPICRVLPGVTTPQREDDAQLYGAAWLHTGVEERDIF